MADKYWDKFYKEKKQAITTPSPFVKWFANNFDKFGMEKKMSLIELGAGCGRDTYLLEENFDRVVAIDENNTNYKVKLGKVSEWSMKPYHIIYSRFFLHCLSDLEILNLIEDIGKRTFFVAEFRVKGDKPVLYQNHKRNFIDTDWLLAILIREGFNIRFIQTSRGLAKFKSEDPLVCRIIAYRYEHK